MQNAEMQDLTFTAPNGEKLSGIYSDMPTRISWTKERKIRVMVMGAREFAECRDILFKRLNRRIL